MTEKEDRKYIVLYADEFDYDTWKSYCEAIGIGVGAEEVTIY